MPILNILTIKRMVIKMKISLELLDQNGNYKKGQISADHDSIPFHVIGDDLVTFGTKEMVWQVGDQIKVTIEKPQQYLWVQLDETLQPSLIYLAGTTWSYQIPFADNLIASQLDTAFRSKRHYLMVRRAQAFEIRQYRNLAFNAHDQYQASDAYPHAFANVETRGESVFFAKNAIDGCLANQAHGSYPFQSWGINQQSVATLTIDFGRLVAIDRLALLFRGDYPHDSYWEKVTITFSDKTRLTLDTQKQLALQTFKFSPKKTTTLQLSHLIKANDDSPFPALTQIEVYGYNVIA